jgi:hypothetical protein
LSQEKPDESGPLFLRLHLIWSPIGSVNTGIEYLWGYRELENGEDGDINRVQFSAQYLF